MSDNLWKSWKTTRISSICGRPLSLPSTKFCYRHLLANGQTYEMMKNWRQLKDSCLLRRSNYGYEAFQYLIDTEITMHRPLAKQRDMYTWNILKLSCLNSNAIARFEMIYINLNTVCLCICKPTYSKIETFGRVWHQFDINLTWQCLTSCNQLWSGQLGRVQWVRATEKMHIEWHCGVEGA